MTNKEPILVLNKYYMPVGVDNWKNAICNIFSGAVYGLDIHYEKNEEGQIDPTTIEYWEVVKNIKQWASLVIRPYDDFIQTVSGPIRVPTVVVCANYKGIVYPKVKFPTKRNIWDRDKFTCVYTGKKLSKNELSVDHIVPTSLGGKSTWENLVTCDRILNSQKGNKLLNETNLKLRYKPYKPKNGFGFDIYREEWHAFLANL